MNVFKNLDTKNSVQKCSKNQILKNALIMVPRGGIEPPTQGFSVHDSRL